MITKDGVTVLPDGSGFFTASFPLPKDHWLTADGHNVPPMPWRMKAGEGRTTVAEKVREAAKYAIRASTANGTEQDFDPDAMVQNFVVAMLGYWTADGLSSDAWANPDPVPPLYDELYTTGLREGLRQAAAVLQEVRAGLIVLRGVFDAADLVEGIKSVDHLIRVIDANAAPTEVTRG